MTKIRVDISMILVSQSNGRKVSRYFLKTCAV